MADRVDVHSLRHVFGMNRRSPVTESFSRFHFDEGFRDLPRPTGSYPFHLDLEDILGGDQVQVIAAQKKMVFHALGDTGNAKHGAEAQEAIAEHLVRQRESLTGAEQPLFFYHLGDVVYYNGERRKYEPQFYDPYLLYTAPIFAIPGNHDGDVLAGDTPLQGFMENFASAQPVHTWMAGQSNRTTMIQPNCYWTLKTPLATIIGLYSNVGGVLDGHDLKQEKWLIDELTAVKNDRCVIVAVHHPPYSLDDVHGGHAAIRESLDRAFRASGRIPNLVLTAHVHNYQRFKRNMSGFGGTALQYLVAGAGGFAGYSSLHQLKDPRPTLPDGIQLVESNTDWPGFLKITVTDSEIECVYYTVNQARMPKDTKATEFERFTIPL
jgi:hypothetical protein